MKYIYGPVPSRRLGNSLGIDLIPSKTCNYQCIYCQLGKTTIFTNSRKNYFSKYDIIIEMNKAIILNEENIDYITFVGSGEPTLYKDLKKLIIAAKEISDKPICVITNGGLLYNKEVREALMLADVVLPSLDAGDEKSFLKINRPHPSINYDAVIEGLTTFQEEFKGKLWVEIMVMRNINDSREELKKIKEKIDSIKPDRIDINIPIRPPAENWVNVPDISVLSIINEIFCDHNRINYPERGKFRIYSSNFEEELLSIIKRHPMRQEQIIETFSSDTYTKEDILTQLRKLVYYNKIKGEVYRDRIYWKSNRN